MNNTQTQEAIFQQILEFEQELWNRIEDEGLTGPEALKVSDVEMDLYITDLGVDKMVYAEWANENA